MIPISVAVVAAYETIIAGGGPAGLTAAYELSKHGKSCVVLESDPRMVGGISRTDQYKGYRFDIGGHRFFSKSDEVNAPLARDPRRRVPHPRPPQPDLLRPQVLPLPAQARRCALEAGLPPLLPDRGQLPQGPARPRSQPERSVEDWVVNRFGRVLFEIFFKSYTEKVWGMPTSEISADWAAQRIKDLDLVRAVTSALFGRLAIEAGRGHQDADRRIPVSAARPGPDVGSGPRPDPRAGRRGPARSPRGPDRARRLGGDRLPDPRRRGPADPLPGPPFPLDAARSAS